MKKLITALEEKSNAELGLETKPKVDVGKRKMSQPPPESELKLMPPDKSFKVTILPAILPPSDTTNDV